MQAVLFAIIVFFTVLLSTFSLSSPRTITLATREYSKCLQAQPLLTNVITASALCVLSDFISQSFERSKANASFESDRILGKTTSSVPRHSLYRSLCMGVYGATVYGWLITYWFKLLNSIVPQENITFLLVLKKVTINQFFMSPILNSLFFTYVTLTRELKSDLAQKIRSVKMKLGKDLIPTIKRSCVYWGIIQTINFSSVPTSYQLLYTNSAFVMWTTYIAFVGFQKLET
jgi:Mpv17 / PMP22 family